MSSVVTFYWPDVCGEEIDIYEACFQDMYEVMKLVKERFIRENNNENDNETEEKL